MTALIARLNERKNDRGFTLVELLVVITILGILAAVVVFSVSGVNDRGQTAACKTDSSTIRTAEEAYYSKNSTYVPLAQLQGNFLSNPSTLHTLTVNGTGKTATYTIAVATTDCGTVGANVDGSTNF